MDDQGSGMDVAARFAAIQPPLPAPIASELEAALRTSPDPRVRGTALGALMRAGSRRRARGAWQLAVADPEPAVRRRAAELAPTLDPVPCPGLLALLTDADPLVGETAAWALGEGRWSGATRTRVVNALATATREHADPLVRESAVAALGAIGDPRGLPAILGACGDRPPVRRRAVLALAPFEGPAVDTAIEAALTDADWQVRQAAEDLR